MASKPYPPQKTKIRAYIKQIDSIYTYSAYLAVNNVYKISYPFDTLFWAKRWCKKRLKDYKRSGGKDPSELWSKEIEV